MNPKSQKYYPRILKQDNTVVGDLLEPFPVASCQFTETVSVSGQGQGGSFVLALLDSETFTNLKPIYADLNYWQRVELYTNNKLLGNPVFAGLIQNMPQDSQRNEIRGPDTLWLLDNQPTRQNERLVGNVNAILREMLKTYQWTFMDDFNRSTGFGADWQFSGAGTDWSIANNRVERTGNLGGRLQTATDYAFTVWQNSKIHFRFYWPSTSLNQTSIEVDFGGPYPVSRFTIIHKSFNDGVNAFVDTEDGDYYCTPKLNDGWNDVDIYLSTSGTTTTAVLDINTVTVLTHPFTNAGAASRIEFDITQTGPDPVYLDDFVFCTLANAIQPGTIDPTAAVIDQRFNGDSHKAVLDRLVADRNWEYRINYGRDWYSDTLDIGASVGTDLSDVVILEEGKNFEKFERNRAADAMATWATVRPQSNDDSLNGFSSVDIASIRTFGIIHKLISDPRVVTAEIAQTIGDAYLLQAINGKESLSGRVTDESWMVRQKPMLGYAIWGDFVWGGRQVVRAGDWVWTKTRREPAVDKKSRIVSVTRKDGDPGYEFTADSFRWGEVQQIQKLQEQLLLAQRAWAERANSIPTRLVFAAANTDTISVILHGILSSVLLDVRSAAWGGASVTTLTLDGVDVTVVLGGPWTDDFQLDISAYWQFSGEHTLGIAVDAAVTLDIQPITRLWA